MASNDVEDTPVAAAAPAEENRVLTTTRLSDKPKLLITGSDSGAEVYCVAFSPDGQLIAAGCGDGVVRVYSAATGRLSYNLSPGRVTSLPITCVRWRAYTPTQTTKNVLISTGADGMVRHWHVTSCKCLHAIHEENNQVYCTDFRPDTQRFATVGKDRTVRLYDEGTKTLISSHTGGHGDITAGHANRVFSIKYHPIDEHLLMTGGWDNTIQVWDDRVPHAVRSIFGPHICGDALDVYDNVILAASWRPDNALQMFDFTTGRLIDDLDWGTAPGDDPCLLYSCQFSKGNADLMAAGGSGSNETKVFDRATKQVIGTYVSPKGVYTLDFSPNTKLLAVAGGDSSIRVLQLRTELKMDPTAV